MLSKAARERKVQVNASHRNRNLCNWKLGCLLPSTYPETADEQEGKNFPGITADKPETQMFGLLSVRCQKAKLSF